MKETAGGNGAVVGLLSYLTKVLECEKPNNKQPIHLKISFDGAKMTSGKQLQQEISSFELLYDAKTLAGKDPTHIYNLL